jgi:TetR/AcrR family transcriptional regulator, transcriptional repressor for nem operon
MSSTDAAPAFTKKGMATRARIVKIAAELIFERGVGDTSIEDVCREAKVSTSQIYHYFGDRHGLLRAVVQYQAEATAQCSYRGAGALDSIPALRAWAKSHVDIQEQRHCVGGCTFGSLVGQVSEVEPATYEDFRNGFSKWQQPIIEGLNAMQRRGELRSGAKPAELAEALMASLQGGLLLTQAQRTHRPLQVALATMIDYIESLTVNPPA